MSRALLHFPTLASCGALKNGLTGCKKQIVQIRPYCGLATPTKVTSEKNGTSRTISVVTEIDGHASHCLLGEPDIVVAFRLATTSLSHLGSKIASQNTEPLMANSNKLYAKASKRLTTTAVGSKDVSESRSYPASGARFPKKGVPSHSNSYP